jgi:hypothetical protein
VLLASVLPVAYPDSFYKQAARGQVGELAVVSAQPGRVGPHGFVTVTSSQFKDFLRFLAALIMSFLSCGVTSR